MNNEELKPYIQEIDLFYVQWLESCIEKYGKDEVYEKQLRDIDCTLISKEGMRLQQTTSYRYKYELTHILYLISNYFDNDEDKYQQIYDIHKRNLEYEILNPPIKYDKLKQQKTKKKKVKQTEIEFGDIKPKSIAKQKLAIKASRINLLKFNINVAK